MTTVARAFVAGATGYTGQGVVKALRERGVETWAHVRPDSKSLADWQQRFGALGATVDTTAWTAAAMDRRFEELAPTIVFSLLGTTRKREAQDKRAGGDSSYEAVDYGMSIMALHAAGKAGPNTRFVYLSSLGTNATTGNAYLAVRWRVEDAVRASGLPYIIARPSFITGSDRAESRPVERVAAVIADGALGALALLGGKRLRDRYGSNSSESLGKTLARLALDPAARGVYESEQLR